jgi:hypothetical protein
MKSTEKLERFEIRGEIDRRDAEALRLELAWLARRHGVEIQDFVVESIGVGRLPRQFRVLARDVSGSSGSEPSKARGHRDAGNSTERQASPRVIPRQAAARQTRTRAASQSDGESHPPVRR